MPVSVLHSAWVLFPLALALAAVPFGCAARTEPPKSAASPLLSRDLPEFRRRALSGGSFDSKSHQGRVVVVKFFAKYCVPCVRTLPAAEALHRKYEDVAFLGVSEDEASADALSQVRLHALTFPVVLDSGHALAGVFRVKELPSVFVADRAGRVVWVGGPNETERDLEEIVEAARTGDVSSRPGQ